MRQSFCYSYRKDKMADELDIFSGGKKFRVAAIQHLPTERKDQNLQRLQQLVVEAAKKGAKLIVLPEFATTLAPNSEDDFRNFAEEIPGPSTDLLSKSAKDHRAYIVGGSIIESDPSGKLYNTCLVFDPYGRMILKYRKIHLFKIDRPGRLYDYQEYGNLEPGVDLGIFDTPLCKIGVGLCYDIRFQELAQIYCQKGCKLLLYPGAFNTVTGPAHLAVMQRARAIDHQVYVVTASPARDNNKPYTCWGYSSVIDPWGKIIAQAGEHEEVIMADVDLDYVDEVRQQIPVQRQKRNDLYSVYYTGNKSTEI